LPSFFRDTVIVGLFFQQAIALFVLKSEAGFDIFSWVATLASDFLAQAGPAAGFFFDAETVGKHWFFVNVLVRMGSSWSSAGSWQTAHAPPHHLRAPSFSSLLSCK